MNADHQKTFKKLTLFFLLNPFPFNRQDCEKETMSGTNDWSLFMLQLKIKSIPLLVMYYLTKFEVLPDQVS